MAAKQPGLRLVTNDQGGVQIRVGGLELQDRSAPAQPGLLGRLARFSGRAVVKAAEEIVEAVQAVRATPPRQPTVQEELAEARAMIAELQAELEAIRGLAQTQTQQAGHPEAARLLDREPLFLDYETTGLAQTDQVIEVAVMDRAGRVVLSTLVDPQRPIPAAASAVNGITDRDVAGAPTWDQVTPLLSELLAGRVVVAHWARFEKKFTPAATGIEWVCSKALADRVLGKPRRGEGTLAARLAQLGLRPGPEHTAAGDCLSCLRLVKRLAGDHSPVEINY